ncbi:MAG TPA: NAD(P)/FAD-dependent oxidoreductase, partial [Pseudolysinimonas sp.]|nr:NAD(P)/FAD-dependent oxidoreductase [Pseudolysinimonas sp.]
MTTTDGGGTVDAVVIGAGFAGIHLVHRLRQEGFTTRAFESGGDVGGTWYWNRYPGARCDVESLHYCYFFDENLVRDWQWTERFATQPEILRYLNWVVDRLDVRSAFTFDTRVAGASYDEKSATWLVSTETGEVVRARFLIPAVGALSAASIPQLPGAERFRGRTLHSGSWPHEPVILAGQRV